MVTATDIHSMWLNLVAHGNTVATTSSNVFTFEITNNSTSSQVVNWGYTKI